MNAKFGYTNISEIYLANNIGNDKIMNTSITRPQLHSKVKRNVRILLAYFHIDKSV
jgi:hypothetical protein